MLTILQTELDNRVKINALYESVFITDTFMISRKLVNNYIEISLTVRDIHDAAFNTLYYLEFFGYASKYTGYFVCSKVEKYAPKRSNAVFLCVIPLIENDEKRDDE